MVVLTFVLSCLDYCNSLVYDISDILLWWLQAIQKAVVCLVTGTRSCDHITSVLQQLHLLPVRQQVEFKLAVLVYKALKRPSTTVSVRRLSALIITQLQSHYY